MTEHVRIRMPNTTDARRSHLVFWLILSANLLDMIDWGILQVALPSIGAEFHAGLDQTQWVIGSYGITMASCLLLAGRAGDKFSHSRVFLWGVGMLGAASLAGALSTSMTFLVGARLVQGVGAAMSSVAGLAIFMGLFQDERERNKYFGILMAANGVGFALGNAVGGVMTSLLGWRSILFVHAPITLAIIVMSIPLMSADERPNDTVGLDIAGGLTLTAGLLALVYALTNAATFGFSATATISPFIASLAVFAAFAIVERRHQSPLIPASFWSNRGVVVASSLCLLFGATGGFSVLLVLYWQDELGYSAAQAGLAILPVPVTVFTSGMWIAARVLNAYGPVKTLFVSLALNLVGVLLMMQYARGWSWLAPGMILFALGASFEFGAINAIAMANARPGEEGLTAGAVNTAFRVGLPLGLAILVVLAQLASPNRIENGLQASFGGILAMIVVALMLLLFVRRPLGVSNGAGPRVLGGNSRL